MRLHIALFSTVLMLSAISHAAPSTVSKEEAREIAVDAYVYAYPMVIAELTRRVNASSPFGGMNKLIHRRAFPDDKFTEVVRPNADTLYSILWFDVSQDPLVLDIPNSNGRYYLLQFMDLWTDTFAVPGTRTTGSEAQKIVLADAKWMGVLPAGALLIRSPTSIGWMIGRTQTNGVGDYSAVRAFQNGMSAAPFDAREKVAATKGATDPTWDLSAPPVVAIEKLSGQKYFELFADLLQANPPHANDYPIVHRMARIGIEPGKSFSYSASPGLVREAIDSASAVGLKTIKGGLASIGIRQNGWRTNLSGIGTYGTDYRARAAVAFGGLGANPIEDAIYPIALADSEGNPFSSDNRYVLHFSKAEIPPARAFWSLTMYDSRQLFTANPINRYAIGDRDKLEFNADGSLDLYIQRDSPGENKTSNWLPAPAQGPFTMNLRLYWPRNEALNGTWLPPPVRRVR